MRLLAALLALASLAAPAETALDRYVATPDPAYRYALVETRRSSGGAEYVLEMVSQSWRSTAEIDRTLWTHWLTVIVPAKTAASTALLFITGGANDGKLPRSPANLRQMAFTTNSVVAELRMVPNQPLKFPRDAEGRVEDSFIAYTWDKFLRGGDELWPARLPMTKSAVRAMDTVTSFCARPEIGVKVDRFVVSGASKRGWTTWTTAAVDKRVAAVIPIVIDALNVEKSFEHHYRTLGFWAPAIHDYEEMGIPDWFGTPEFRRLMQIVDPYSYLDRLTMPKFMVNAAGDQFFLPDSSRFYFDDLQGEKYLRYVANADHSLKDSDAFESIQAFYSAFLAGRPRPRFTWSFENDGGIRVKTETAPSEVRLWQAVNAKARDFRVETIGPAYRSTVLAPERPGEYLARATRPPRGYTAYFVELTFPSGGPNPFKFTTPVRIEPDRLPFPAPERKRRPATSAAR